MAIYANYLTYKLLEEVGLPKGVIQFIPIDASKVEQACNQVSALSFGPITSDTNFKNGFVNETRSSAIPISHPCTSLVQLLSSANCGLTSPKVFRTVPCVLILVW